jgi:hypothetical protein
MKYLLTLFILLFGCSCGSTSPSVVSEENYVTRDELRHAYECLQARHEYERQAEICQSTVTSNSAVLCTNTCGPAQAPNAWVGDGECDDGGENSLFNVCPLGTDCQDCGPRSADGTEAEGYSQEDIDIACALVIDYFDQCPGIR